MRAVDASVEALELSELGFEAPNRVAGGRSAYHPGALLYIYIYGYPNRIPSSRRLAREAQRNLGLIWLTERLASDFETIADFRKNNGGEITAVCRSSVALCRTMKVFSHAVIAFDGSKLKAVNSRNRNFTAGKIKARRKQLDESVARYLAELDRANCDPTLLPEGRVPHFQTALREWAYARAYDSSDQRQQALPQWLHQYNWHRPHASLGYESPASRLQLPLNNVMGLHSQPTVDEFLHNLGRLRPLYAGTRAEAKFRGNHSFSGSKEPKFHHARNPMGVCPLLRPNSMRPVKLSSCECRVALLASLGKLIGRPSWLSVYR